MVATILVCGCYPDWPEQPSTAMVHGVVLLDDSPLSQAKIVFLPLSLRSNDDELMPIAYGMTDTDGKFELAYSNGTRELAAGTYTVMISKVKQDTDGDGNSLEPWREELLPDSVAGLSAFKEQGELIPSIYNRDSTLTYEVQASPSIIRPKFELSSVDPELTKLSTIDSLTD